MKRNERKTLAASKQRSLITHLTPKSTISEQFRTIRTNIDFSLVDTELKTLMVTSSSPGEGKSTIAANMAVVMAQQGKKVLLVDADLRKPTVHYTFRINNTFGLTNVLTRHKTIEEAVVETDVDHLHVLSSGPVPPNPAELLGSVAMSGLIKKATEIYDAVIFDTPPALAVTDAQVMTNQCDGTILVVRSGHTENEAALQSKELLA